MKDSYVTRFRITKKGKILRRPMRIGHNLAKKRGKLTRMKRKKRGLDAPFNVSA